MRRSFALGLLVLLLPVAGAAQARVEGRVSIQHAAKSPGDDSQVVVALTPVDGDVQVPVPDKHYRLAQKNRTFQPHLLVIPEGATVDFPNLDPLFHNVFSLFNGKRFDLGLYEAGSSRSVKFSRPGVSYIFCNIHPEMSAVVMTMATPYYDVTDASGHFSIPNVPPGEYKLSLWYERASADELAKASQRVTIRGNEASLGTIAIAEAPNLPASHKNKYGRDYDTTAPYDPGH